MTEKQIKYKKEMEVFKQILTKPYISENIYKDMNIENLIMIYERSLKDIEQWNQLFNITDQNRNEILNEYTGEDYLEKPKLRKVFEEICYTTQLTNE